MKISNFPRTSLKGVSLKNGGSLYIVLNMNFNDAYRYANQFSSSFLFVSRKNLTDDFSFEYLNHQVADPCSAVFEEIFKNHDLVYEPLERFEKYLNDILGKKYKDFDERLKRVVLTYDGILRYIWSQTLYKTKERKKEPSEKTKEYEKRIKEWEEDRRNKLKSRFDAFVKKYNDAVELHNSKCKMIVNGYKVVHIGREERKLIEGRYSVNYNGSIDIDGNFIMTEIYDYDTETKTWKEDPVFVIDDFPFRLRRVTGEFKIVSTHIKNLDMFPRSAGAATVSCNQNLSSIRGIARSEIWGRCFIRCAAETLYFPDYVGGNLIIDNRCWKDFGSDKTVKIDGRCTFCNISSTDPRVAKIKEIVKAKRYEFHDASGKNIC
ncbi:hypothetical protein J5690_02480 [bacterium]|nr:hypothetical protein [bacterium]